MSCVALNALVNATRALLEAAILLQVLAATVRQVEVVANALALGIRRLETMQP